MQETLGRLGLGGQTDVGARGRKGSGTRNGLQRTKLASPFASESTFPCSLVISAATTSSRSSNNSRSRNNNRARRSGGGGLPNPQRPALTTGLRSQARSGLPGVQWLVVGLWRDHRHWQSGQRCGHLAAVDPMCDFPKTFRIGSCDVHKSCSD